MFSEKISASTCSSKEKAGLKNNDDTKIVYERILAWTTEGAYEFFLYDPYMCFLLFAGFLLVSTLF